jgi:hypothetical protein
MTLKPTDVQAAIARLRGLTLQLGHNSGSEIGCVRCDIWIQIGELEKHVLFAEPTGTPPAEYGLSKSMDKRLQAQGKPEPTGTPCPLPADVARELETVNEQLANHYVLDRHAIRVICDAFATRAQPKLAANEIVEECALTAIHAALGNPESHETAERAAREIRALKGKFSAQPNEGKVTP